MKVIARAAVAAVILLSSCTIFACAQPLGRGTRGLHSRGLKDAPSCSVGTYTPLKPSVLESKVVALDWVGVDDQYVFAVTQKNRVWRSNDGGSSFSDITERFNSSIHGAEPISILAVKPNKDQPNQVLFIGAGEYMWLSQDYGDTVTPLRNPGGFRGVHAHLRSHPLKPQWMLLMAKRPDCRSLDEYEMSCPNDLFVTQTGYTDPQWVNLTSQAGGKVAGFVDFDWAQQLCKHTRCAASPIAEASIFATMYEHAGDWDMAWDPDIHFVRSDDFFKSIPKKVPCGNQFEVVGPEVYLAVSNRCPLGVDGHPVRKDAWAPGITLYTSSDGANTFSQTCLPVALKQEGYELMESHDGNGTVIIVDYIIKSAVANLQASSAYTSGPHHRLFSLSLSNIYRTDLVSAASDFARVERLPGVYIANTMVPRHDDGGSISQLFDRPLVETRISFNGGGVWEPLKPPRAFNFPACDRCSGAPDCKLHLHGSSSWFFGAIQFPTTYSHPSAPGLIMASGNVGTEGVGLDDNEAVCTFMSSDGGVTWTDVAEGTFIYEYADWGGVIVMTRHQLSGVAEEVLFSLDYGKCWHRVPLEVALTVDNIRIEPDGQRPKVVVHGKACHKDASPKCNYDPQDKKEGWGLTYSLDVEALVGKDQLVPCRPTDYENWTIPATDYSPRCLLGQRMAFTRRRQASQCLQGADFVRPPPTNTTCECTVSDTECDFGFVADGEACKQLPDDKLPACPTISIEHAYAVSSSGRRIVHGDVCANVGAVIADTDGRGAPLPGYKPPPGGAGGDGGGGKGGGGGFVTFMVLVGLAVGAVAWWQYLAGPRAKEAVLEAWGSAQVLALSLAAWTADALARCLPGGGGGGGGGGGLSLSGLSLGGRGGGGGGAGSARYDALDAELNYFQPLPEGGGLDEPPPPQPQPRATPLTPPPPPVRSPPPPPPEAPAPAPAPLNGHPRDGGGGGANGGGVPLLSDDDDDSALYTLK